MKRSQGQQPPAIKKHRSTEGKTEAPAHAHSSELVNKAEIDFDTFTAHAKSGEFNLIPVCRELNGDLETPVSALLKVKTSRSPCFLLESVAGGEVQARYSFIGTDPYKVIKEDHADPLVAVEAEMKEYKVMPVEGLPDFTGGGVGYLSYDCVRHFEPTVAVSDKRAIDIPESIFMFFRSIIAFDHVKNTIKVISHGHITGPDSIHASYGSAVSRLNQLTASLAGPLPPPQAPPAAANSKVKSMESNVGQKGYEGFVSSLKESIRQGDIIQAVPSQRLARPLNNVTAFDVYRQLRIINPSPYMFYLDLGSFEVLGASPEQLVKVEGRRVTTHPIAGTRKRGRTVAEDDALAKELLSNEKERAEHIMLVDLGRNDIGRVATPGTVKVDSLMHIERYSHVMHIVSHVSGELDASKSPYDAFRSVFPAGTVSGAPKIRAMQLVSKLENERRGVYAGSVGYVSYSGTLDTCISIRTMVVKDRVAYLQAGGGIVYDSEPTPEYKETIKKMRALANAIDKAEDVAANKLKELSDEKVRDTVMKNYFGKVESLPGDFGRFGGRYVPETLVGALEDLEKEYITALNDPSFKEELRELQKRYVGRPTPLYFAKRLTEHCGGAKIWLKREDLAHTGAHKINNALGQALLAKRMGKKRIIAETGAGQHGVATSTACALLGLKCIIYMGAEDIERQALNVFRIRMLGGEVVPVTSGSRTLKDAVNEAMRDWVTNVKDTFFLIGSAIGPHPFPTIVRDFQCCLGEEARAQMLEQAGKLPDVAVACVGGGSNAIGLFHPFVEDKEVKLVGVEAAGHGIHTGKHSATIAGGTPGVLHGTRTFLIQDDHGQIIETHSISAGLDYPGVGPEHAFLKDSGRVDYVPVTDKEALQGLQDMTRLEGIIPALEPSHAIHYALKLASTMNKDQDLLINLCGRGDKDMHTVAKALGWKMD